MSIEHYTPLWIRRAACWFGRHHDEIVDNCRHGQIVKLQCRRCGRAVGMLRGVRLAADWTTEIEGTFRVMAERPSRSHPAPKGHGDVD